MIKKWKKGDRVVCTLYPSIYSEERGEVLDVEEGYLRVRFNLSKDHKGLEHSTVQSFKSHWFKEADRGRFSLGRR